MPEPMYLIWSNRHGCWWLPDSHGYTRRIEEAGRYDRSEAEDIAATFAGRGEPDEVHLLQAPTDPARTANPQPEGDPR